MLFPRNVISIVSFGYTVLREMPPQGLSGMLHSARMKHEKNHQVLQATAGQITGFVNVQTILVFITSSQEKPHDTAAGAAYLS
jgi:hypothetical protein